MQTTKISQIAYFDYGVRFWHIPPWSVLVCFLGSGGGGGGGGGGLTCLNHEGYSEEKVKIAVTQKHIPPIFIP